MSTKSQTINIEGSWDFSDEIIFSETVEAGINETVVRQISLSNKITILINKKKATTLNCNFVSEIAARIKGIAKYNDEFYYIILLN